MGAAVRASGPAASSPASARLSARRRIEACLEASSYFHSVTNRHTMATSETRNVSRISPGIDAAGGGEHARVDQRLREPHGEEVQRHEGAADDREHRRVAGLALGVVDREAQRLVAGEEQEDDQERDERRLVPHPPDAPGGLGPDRAGGEHAEARGSATGGSPRRSAGRGRGRRSAGTGSRTRRRPRSRPARRSPAARAGRRSSARSPGRRRWARTGTRARTHP